MSRLGSTRSTMMCIWVPARCHAARVGPRVAGENQAKPAAAASVSSASRRGALCHAPAHAPDEPDGVVPGRPDRRFLRHRSARSPAPRTAAREPAAPRRGGHPADPHRRRLADRVHERRGCRPLDRGAQRAGEREHVRVAVGRLLGEPAHHHGVDLRAQRRHQLRRRHGIVVHDLVEHGDRVLAAERLLAREQRVGDRRQRELVAAVIDLLAQALGLLGRHVLRRAGDALAFGQPRPPAGLRDAEVQHLDEVLDAGAAEQHDVFGLEIAVHDPALVRRVQRAGDLLDDVGRRRSGRAAPTAWTRSDSSLPSSSSITRNGTPLSVTLKSNTCTMCGWRSDEVISASWRKRASASLSRTRLRWSSLTAKRPGRRVWAAR